MPTLFRLLATLGVILSLAYGALFALATFLQPEPRQIVQVVALPQDATVRTGRSAASDLDREVRHLTRGHHISASRRNR